MQYTVQTVQICIVRHLWTLSAMTDISKEHLALYILLLENNCCISAITIQVVGIHLYPAL